MANSALYRTNTAPSASGYKYTFSAWVKRSKITDRQQFWRVLNPSATTYYSYLEFQADDKLHFNDYSSNGTLDVATNRLFRDTNAWYHIMAVVDTTQGTASNRVKLYVNGTQETSFASTTYSLGQNQATTGTESGKNNYVGGDLANNTRFFNGYMSHVSFVDGQALAPTVFGQTDSTSGIWKFKSPTGVTFGNNGYHLKFENSGNLGLDSSGEGHNLTVSGNGRQALDTPSNVHATLNPLARWRGENTTPTAVLSNGNLKTGIGSGETTLLSSTLGVSTGKWYWEAKSDGVSKMFYGICNSKALSDSNAPHSSSEFNGIYYYEATPYYAYASSQNSSNIVSISSGDVLNFAMDCDNSTFYIGKNGVYMNGGVPTSGATGTGSINRLFNYAGSLFYDNGFQTEMFPSCYVSSTTGSGTASYNFGNGYFGTTAITSAGSNGNGSLFEYDVPSGYYALNTKNINTYG